MNKSINVNEVDNTMKIIDIRKKADFEKNHIKNAVNVEMQDLLNNPKKYINKKEAVYVVCYMGAKSKIVSNALNNAGYNVISLSGGMNKYKK